MVPLVRLKLCIFGAILLGSQGYLHAAGDETRMMPKLSLSAQYLFTTANEERVARGLPLLRTDPGLTEAAARHARMMAEQEDVSHQFAGEAELAQRSVDAGAEFSLIAENVAEAPDTPEIHRMWMHSDEHRANLLDPDVNCVGVAVVERDGELYAVEDFASSVEELSLPEQEASVAEGLTVLGVKVTRDDAARLTCAKATGFEGTRHPEFIMRYTVSRLDAIPTQLAFRLKTGRYRTAVVGACPSVSSSPFSSYTIAVLLFP